MQHISIAASTLETHLAHAVTRYDRMQDGKKGYNPNALGIYLMRAGFVVEEVTSGITLQEALNENFNDRLRDFVIKYMAKQGYDVKVEI